jgi:UDP-N-acetylmuramoyl-tripeptide--D-alanyl-D-alanine ligase
MFTLDDLIKATKGKILSKSEEVFYNASNDTRTIGQRDIFFALKGTKRDGHEFLKDVLEKASGAVISKNVDVKLSSKTVVMVEDTLKALQDLGKYLRCQFKGKVIAVLGSNGKTTTKELIATLLSKKYKVLKTESNFNNSIGVPLCLSRIENNTEIMVLELGTNKKGDIKELCEIVYPQYAVITNIGYEHLEGFGSLEGVREGELEVLSYIKTLFANGDDEFLMEGLKDWKEQLVTFGFKKKHNYYSSNVDFKNNGMEFVFHTKKSKIPIKTQLTGIYNIYNLTAACAVAVYFGITPDMIKESVKHFSPIRMRSEIWRINGLEILFDAYNANPSSMKAAIDELSRRKKEKRAIAVLGDMLELGSFSQEAHQQLGKWLKEHGIDQFIGVGNFIKEALRYMDGIVFDEVDEAGKFLKSQLCGNEVILIKGSRAIKMERILEFLMEG